ncbi:MAG TPA: hypothetical protein VKZ88_06435 [Fibrobacteria bacterium]|nr:hypothetical protein [Fibrobacteria bacterium]
MMRVSPCAWYCFEIGDDEVWQVREDRETTWLIAPDGSCTIEVAAALRTAPSPDKTGATSMTGGPIDEDEIASIHERYLEGEGIQVLKTALAENPCRVTAYVTRGLGLDEREHIVCHAWWGPYCAFVKYHGRRERATPGRIRAFYDLVDSLQPLVDG